MTSDAIEAELAAMANDPDIQCELRQIEAEFSHTEMDGVDQCVTCCECDAS